jgi:hypothetical protein
VFPG